jgi:hypothetical protein
VTDLDSLGATGGVAVQPAPGAGQVTGNATLKTWIPELADIDALFVAGAAKKTKQHDPLFAVRIDYQTPFKVTVPKSGKEEIAYPYTFEDALSFENLDFFAKLGGYGLVAKFRDAIMKETTAAAIGEKMYAALKTGKKAEFALDIIDAKAFDDLNVPRYIAEGLEWLEKQLRKKQVEILPVAEDTVPVDTTEGGKAGGPQVTNLATGELAVAEAASDVAVGEAVRPGATE